MIVDGFQVPVMPLLEVVGNVGAAAFKQSGPTCVNTGLICVAMVTVNVVDMAH